MNPPSDIMYDQDTFPEYGTEECLFRCQKIDMEEPIPIIEILNRIIHKGKSVERYILIN